MNEGDARRACRTRPREIGAGSGGEVACAEAQLEAGGAGPSSSAGAVQWPSAERVPAIGLERNVLEEEFGEPGSEPCRFEWCLRHPAAGHVETDELEAPRMTAFALVRIEFACAELLGLDEQPHVRVEHSAHGERIRERGDEDDSNDGVVEPQRLAAEPGAGERPFKGEPVCARANAARAQHEHERPCARAPLRDARDRARVRDEHRRANETLTKRRRAPGEPRDKRREHGPRVSGGRGDQSPSGRRRPHGRCGPRWCG